MRSDPIVFVVDDDPGCCDSLRWLLESDGLAVEAYTSAQDFLDAYSPDRSGVLLLDVKMPGMSGLELHRHLLDQRFEIPVIILTGHGDVPMAVRSIKAGAVDFLQKPVHDQILLDRIRRAIRLDAHNREAKSERDAITTRLARLTPREQEVMNLVVSGKGNKHIAREMDLSERTVEVHRKHLMKKMGVHSAVELLHMAMLVNEAPPADGAFGTVDRD